MPRANLTCVQIELLQVIGNANHDGTLIDMDQLLEKISYKTSKQSMQFSLRALVNKGLIEKKPRTKRRGQSRLIIDLTELGRQTIGIRKKSWLEDIGSDVVIPGLEIV